MPSIAEQQRLPPSYGLFTLNSLCRNEQYNSNQWLTEYKKTPGSIFKYYSVQNEFDFLKEAHELSPEGQQYYIKKNIESYLDEFVGEIPYKTIHYGADIHGFTFAGMHVTDSYKKASELSKRNREYAEGVGFQLIEDKLTNKDGEVNPPTSAYWTSPPKDWDYGFEFIFKKETDGTITEYILRYPEKKGELKKSNELLQMIDPQMHELNDADDFLLVPIFGTTHPKNDEDLDSIMRKIGIDEHKIAESHYFGEQVQTVLGSWITEYAKRIITLSNKDKTDIDYMQQIEQAEILLLSIYQQAQDIKNLFPYQKSSPILAQALNNPENTFSQNRFSEQMEILKEQKTLPQANGGSCPVVGESDNPLDSTRFISNNAMLKALKMGVPLENSITGSKTILECKCPHCGEKVKAVIANGTITCPRKKCGKSGPYRC